MPAFTADDGVRLHYAVKGQPPGDERSPLMLVHGFPLTGSLWSELAEVLRTRGLVVVPDLRGFGRSSVPAGPYTMERMAADLVNLLDSLALSSVYVAGHSMGGYVALAMAELYPERLAGLALVHSHPFADNESQREQRYQVAEVVASPRRETWNREQAERLSGEPAVAAGLHEMVAAADSRAIAGASVGMALRPHRAHVWRMFRGDTLHVVGSQDRIIPPARAEETQNERPAGRMVNLKAGHASMMEAPVALAAAIEAWWMPGA